MPATHELRLRAGRSIWQARRCPTTAARMLTRDAETEVLIVGAGISGALIAEALSDAALIWEASDPYLYLRVTPDHRIICGGEDEDFEDEERRDAKLPGN